MVAPRRLAPLGIAALFFGCGTLGLGSSGESPRDPGGESAGGSEEPEEVPPPVDDATDDGDSTPGPDAGSDPLVLHVAADGDDAAQGTSPDVALATLEGVHSRLWELLPSGEVDVLVAPGTYYCRGTTGTWTFANGQRVRIGPLSEVPSPAYDHAEDPDRPVFEGRDESGENCDDSVWFTAGHAGAPMLLTLEGLAVTRYRGGVTIKALDGVDADPDLGIEIVNVVFERIGDKYHYREHDDGTWLEGKGAVLLSGASGCLFADNWFHHVRNVEGSAGLIHAIYFASRASRHRVEGTTFHGCTGAIVKLSDYSNENQFLDNHLSHGEHGLRDRWCGADEDPVTECGGDAQCPSWDNYFPYERNTWGNLDSSDPVTVLDVPEGQTCAHEPPASHVRMDMGEGGVIYGP